MRDDDDLPVLSAVVRGGDAAVIRSMRLDATHADAARGPSGTAPRPARGGRAAAEAPDLARIDVNDLVDRIVDRHVAALRRDVREALERALARIDD